MKSLSFLKLLCSLIFLLISLKEGTSLDSITSDQPLRDNETLVSSNEVFELGFFSLGNPSKRYLGIWYKNTPRQVFWVANRDTPITDPPATLVIGENGNLSLLDRNSTTTWSSSISIAEPENLILRLLNSGNLVLRERTSTSYLWQSFDSPCDTLFPGMNISWNRESGEERFLTSWKSIDDPSIGEMSYRFDNKTLPQLALFSGSVKKFRTRPWNGVQLDGSSSPITEVMTPVTKFDGEEWSYSFEKSDGLFATVITITQSGSVQRLALSDGNSTEWSNLYSVPNVPCNNYCYCGVNAICKVSKSPLCECLQGFVPNSLLEWKEFNWSRGCKRSVNLECSAGDRFWRLVEVKLPDLVEYRVETTMTLEECEAECLRNCSCSAYAKSDVREGRSGCVIWYGNLLDMRELAQQDGNQDVYLRLAASEFESKSKSERKRVNVVIIVISIVFTLSLLSLTIWFIWKRKTGRKGSESETKEKNLPIFSLATTVKEDIDLPIFSLATIAAATRNFSSSNFIGRGGFGSVYKGILPTGQEIAVKRRSVDSGQGIEEFKNEVFMIAKLQHRNLVALLGCCIHGTERMLVYEYMPNKSLDGFIFGLNQSGSLNWETRFNIIMGIARGLLYLHQDSKLQIIHRDLKASNILLDTDMNPKISDFGLARIFSGGENEKKTKKVVGTYGYMSPEYAVDGTFSVKSDVFSFGVVLLEILSGRRNRGFSTPEHRHNLLGHAWMLWNEGEAMKLTDPFLKGICSNMDSQVLRCIQVGLLCVQKFPRDRPTMVSVVLMLSNNEIKIPCPKEPSFFIERSVVGEDLISPDDMSGAGCETTVTLIEGR